MVKEESDEYVSSEEEESQNGEKRVGFVEDEVQALSNVAESENQNDHFVRLSGSASRPKSVEDVK